MTVNATLVKYGTAGGVDINVDHSRIDHNAPVRVNLTADYVIAARLPGAPTRPGLTGRDAKNLDYPRTITSGTTIDVLKAEADALVTAGKATRV